MRVVGSPRCMGCPRAATFFFLGWMRAADVMRRAVKPKGKWEARRMTLQRGYLFKCVSALPHPRASETDDPSPGTPSQQMPSPSRTCGSSMWPVVGVFCSSHAQSQGYGTCAVHHRHESDVCVCVWPT